jgi:hypothetical protein
MDVPTFDTKFSPVYRAGFAGNGPDDLTIQDLKIEIAAAAAIGAGCEHCFVFHGVFL